jgi:hypothetical protein
LIPRQHVIVPFDFSFVKLFLGLGLALRGIGN